MAAPLRPPVSWLALPKNFVGRIWMLPLPLGVPVQVKARPVGRLAYWVVVVVAFFTALSQLRVAEALTQAVFQTLSWALALAIGLLIGLGAKDLVSKILLDWYEKIRG